MEQNGIPSREWIHILPGEKENHRLKSAIFEGYVSFLEGIYLDEWLMFMGFHEGKYTMDIHGSYG